MFDVSAPRGSDEWWLRTLHSRLNAVPKMPNTRFRQERRRGIGRRDWMEVLWSYYDGNPPLAAIDRSRRDHVRDFLRLAHANYAHLTVAALTDRMSVIGVRTASDSDSDGDDAFRRILARSGPWLNDTLRYTFTLGEGCVMVGQGADGGAVITAEDPRQCITVTDPLDPSRVIAGLKVYDDDIEEATYAHLFLGETGQERVRVARRDRNSGWDWVDERSGPLPVQGLGLPLVPFRNALGQGEFEPHLNLLDRINAMIGDRLWLSKIQAFRQRALVKQLDAAPIPQVDPDTGEPINLNAMFESAPDALWDLPPGYQMWESSPLDLSPILLAVRDDVKEFAAVTQTPLFMFTPDAASGSAEGAVTMKENLELKAKDRITRFTPSVKRVARLTLAYSGEVERANSEIDVMWASVERYSLAQRGAAAVAATNSGVPSSMVLSDIWQFTPEAVTRAQRERMADLLFQSLSAAAQSGGEPTQDADDE